MEGTPALFRHRSDAGQRLAAKVLSLSMPPPAVVWGLARGGVAVASLAALCGDSRADDLFSG